MMPICNRSSLAATRSFSFSRRSDPQLRDFRPEIFDISGCAPQAALRRVEQHRGGRTATAVWAQSRCSRQWRQHRSRTYQSGENPLDALLAPSSPTPRTSLEEGGGQIERACENHREHETARRTARCCAVKGSRPSRNCDGAADLVTLAASAMTPSPPKTPTTLNLLPNSRSPRTKRINNPNGSSTR